MLLDYTLNPFKDTKNSKVIAALLDLYKEAIDYNARCYAKKLDEMENETFDQRALKLKLMVIELQKELTRLRKYIITIEKQLLKYEGKNGI